MVELWDFDWRVCYSNCSVAFSLFLHKIFGKLHLNFSTVVLLLYSDDSLILSYDCYHFFRHLYCTFARARTEGVGEGSVGDLEINRFNQSMRLLTSVRLSIPIPRDVEILPVGSGVKKILQYYSNDINRLAKLFLTVDFVRLIYCLSNDVRGIFPLI